MRERQLVDVGNTETLHTAETAEGMISDGGDIIGEIYISDTFCKFSPRGISFGVIIHITITIDHQTVGAVVPGINSPCQIITTDAACVVICIIQEMYCCTLKRFVACSIDGHIFPFGFCTTEIYIFQFGTSIEVAVSNRHILVPLLWAL